MSDLYRIACFGDVVGRTGRAALRAACAQLRQEPGGIFIVANGENAAGGTGITGAVAEELLSGGVDLLTTGDHVWQNKEASEYLAKSAARCLRPANFVEGAPGVGWSVREEGPARIGVLNLIGRIFMNPLVECPFKTARAVLDGPLKGCSIVVCDFHAEATSEKVALGRFLDGRVTLLVGTHTHVQTADEQVLPGGTGYITDLGMCGSSDGVIGMDGEVALSRFLTGRPFGYRLAKGGPAAAGVLARIDLASGKVVSIERICQRLEE
jgi:2',3'-cyclic-nucleotide 2'-phosphodiesterase